MLAVCITNNTLALYTQSIEQVFDVKSSQQLYEPQTVAELQTIVQSAYYKNYKISVVGAGKSQGGQTISSHSNSYRIDLHKFNKLICLNIQQKLVTVQAGMTWKRLQEHIAPHGLAVKTMQSYNDFSIGGSISVNVHGQDISTGQIVSTILSLKILLSNGTIITASPDKNSDIFYAAVGGYGLIGIIVEATLQLTDDIIIKRHAEVIKTASLTDHFNEHIRNNPTIEFYSARFSVGSSDFMKHALVITYSKGAPRLQNYQLLPTKQGYLVKWMIQATGCLPIFKNLRFPLEQLILNQAELTSRNNFFNYSIQGLPQNSDHFEYILQEYFLPYDHVTSFIEQFAKLTKHYDINVLNVTGRHVHKDTKSLLSFSPHNDMCALVVYIKLPKTCQAQSILTTWTQLMIDEAIKHGGTYYLPYHLLATQYQFETAYPRWSEFLAIKRQYDPHAMFSNLLYEKYYKKIYN